MSYREEIIFTNADKLNGKTNGKEKYDIIGDNHIATSIDTPMRADAFELSDERKMEIIEDKFRDIMETMGLDLNDDSLSGTPHRVAKMFVQEIFSGLNPANKPKVSVFENKFKYGEMLVEKNINMNSTCEHHFLPIVGKAHVAYISSGEVIGLSKINRIVDYFARRPQVQERLTVQIANELKTILKTDDVAVVIDAKHMCVSSRGIQDESSSTVTAEYSGKFKDRSVREEFLKYVEL
ncbi:GTP cyclohydrolase I FolE [Draconibacterium sp. IB214405]|uniref:GTP cyclohydrolase I FolE n=1 Tax=Draconibacterium sp. IB214405 TaxID=3097352 RepID=UPI002A16FDB4|nr:GTP cyclohydrolase I FolE [Draconibacterium sp. IB214405]MDX8339070.1 GTP cyclohydrolase I FolE [Draconibacterium sp. IB214405]